MKLKIVVILSCWCIYSIQAVDQECDKNSLYELDISGLLQAVDDNNECLSEAQAVIESRSPRHVYMFSGPFDSDEKNAINESALNNGSFKRVEFKNFNVIKKFFEYFGSIIDSIGINFKGIDSTEGKQIIGFINEKTSESLVLFYLKNCREDLLDGLKNEFPKIQEFRFSRSLKHELNFNADNPKLNQLFPSLKNLYIDKILAADWEFIGDKLPNLQVFHIMLPKSREDGAIDESQIINFLKKNSQIRNFQISEGELSKEQFAILPEILPKLDILDLSCASKFVAEDIISFIEKCELLFEFNVNVEMDEEEQRRFTDMLPNKFPKLIINPTLVKNGDKVHIRLQIVIGSFEISSTGNGENGNVSGGAGFLAANHSIQMIAVTLILCFIKLF